MSCTSLSGGSFKKDKLRTQKESEQGKRKWMISERKGSLVVFCVCVPSASPHPDPYDDLDETSSTSIRPVGSEAENRISF